MPSQPIADFIIQHGFLTIAIGPFAISFEGADAENSSDFMKIVLDPWRLIAHKARCAVWLIDHSFARDPIGTAAARGDRSETTVSAACNLTDEARRLKFGYGPICSKHWSLPWGRVTKVDKPKAADQASP